MHPRLTAASAVPTTTFAAHVRLAGSIADGVALARRPEEAGVDSIHVIEGTRDAFVPLAAMAAERIGLGTYVANAFMSHPAGRRDGGARPR